MTLHQKQGELLEISRPFQALGPKPQPIRKPPVAGPRRWFVIETEVQREAKAMKALRKKGYRCYWPKLRKSLRHHRSKKLFIKRFQLFNRYVFVSLPNDFENHIAVASQCDGVSEILGLQLDGKACEIDRAIVRRFMLAQRHGEFDNIIPSTRRELADKLPIGTKIRVHRQHFAFGGFFGLVQQIKGKGVVTAGLSIFGRLVPVELRTGDITIIRE